MLHYSYCLSVLPTDNSYLIHLYNFSWKENENDRKIWEVLLMIKIIHQIYIQGYEALNEHLQKYCMMWMRMYGKDWEYKFWSDEEFRKPFVKRIIFDLYDIYKNLVKLRNLIYHDY